MGTHCAPLIADIFLYSYEAEFIQSLLSTGRKRLASQFNFTYRYIDEVLSINNPDFENILVRCIPLNLRSKTRRRATLLFPRSIYSCKSVGTINSTLPFTTSAKILISILQTFRSWAATPNLGPHMAFLSHNISDTPGLAPLMNVLFFGPLRFSDKLLGQGYENERLRSSLRKFYGRYGDLMRQYEVPLSRMLHDILDDDHLQWHPPLIRQHTNVWPFYRSGPYYRIWLFT